MIELIRAYHLDKHKFQEYIINSDDYRNVKMHFNVWNKEIEYPLEAERDGIIITADEYRAYIIGFPRIIYNSSEIPRLTTFKNLTFSKLKTSLKTMDNFIFMLENTKISGLKVGFSVSTNTLSSNIIRLNILMHKYNYYNHDKQKNKKQILKEFDSTNFSIGVYTDRINTCNEKVLKIVLHLKKSVEFKTLNINSINDLLQKEKLKTLFEILMKRFNELIIVDNIGIIERFESKDYHQLKDFLDYRYWNNIASTKSRQTLLRQRKQFQTLIAKYDLDSQKLHMEHKLKKAFKQFISN